MMRLPRFLTAGTLAIRDGLRGHRQARMAAATLAILRAGWTRDLAKRLEKWAQAWRWQLMDDGGRRTQDRLRPWVEDPAKAAVWREKRIGWSRYPAPKEHGRIAKGVVLKAPGPQGERGVLLCSFDYSWLPVLNSRNRESLLRRYSLLAATPWSPPDFATLWSLAHLPKANVGLFISHERDQEWMRRLNGGFLVLPFLMSHWTNPADYRPRIWEERDIDILMVANWAAFKRHWVLFKALHRMPASRRVVLVGQPEGNRTLNDVRREAAAFGVADRIEFRERLGIDEVTALQCRSRVSLVLSRREGSCVVVAESLFADTPVGLLEGAHIGSGQFLNDQTGRWLREPRLARDLEAFLEAAPRFQARHWATEHISAERSNTHLNALLGENALRRKEPWCRDCEPLGWRPNPCHRRQEERDRLASAYDELEQEHGLTFPRTVVPLPGLGKGDLS